MTQDLVVYAIYIGYALAVNGIREPDRTRQARDALEQDVAAAGAAVDGLRRMQEVDGDDEHDRDGDPQHAGLVRHHGSPEGLPAVG